MANKPKIILWDLETAHNVAAIFSLYEERTPHTNILQEKYIICAAYKELGAKSVKAVSVADDMDRFKADPNDDYYVVKHMHEVLSSADAIIAHYGDKYDLRFFNMRAIYHGLTPLPNIITIDTYKIAKSKFYFNSNRLDYLGKFLGFEGKMPTSPGLWLRCLSGDVKAIKEMVKYCKQDITLLEQVFEKLRPYAVAKLNSNLFTEEHVCPSCGSTDLIKRGFQYSRARKYQRYQCNSCGHWSKSNKSIKVNKPETSQ